ncbi:M64 family metallopeptidase [Bacillus sp. JJ1532]|uniref:M64 family metallopeptidase n=1 Tax=Bacillus sp. JJ1532 TaxID=3122958 RepID=UPI002FFF0BFE
MQVNLCVQRIFLQNRPKPQVSGPAEERLNLFILGDGYTSEEMDKFREDVDRNQNVQWSVEPFRSYRNYFKVYMIETPSNDSGISCDPDDGNVRRDTVFNLQYASQCPSDPLARGVTYGTGGRQAHDEIVKYVASQIGIAANAQNIQTLNIANTDTYGGIGGTNATTTGGSHQGPLVSLHELGHSLDNYVMSMLIVIVEYRVPHILIQNLVLSITRV